MAYYKSMLDGNPSLASVAWSKLNDLKSELANDPDALNALALLNAQRGDSAEAARLFRQVLVSDPDNLIALSNLGLLLTRDNRLKESIAMLHTAFDRNQSISGLAMNLARVECMAGDAAATLTSRWSTIPILRACNISSPSSIIVKATVANHEDTKLTSPLRSLLLCTFVLLFTRALVSQTAPDPLAEQRRLIAAGALDQAHASLQAYLIDHPRSADAHFLLGYIYFHEKKAKESLAEFTEGAKGRRPTANELEIVASDYVLLKDYSDADKWFTQVIVETPYNANAWYLLGRTKYNEERFDEALACFQKTLSLRPRDVEAQNNLGLAYGGMNKVDQAKAAFQTAIEWQGSTPTDAQPYLNLGSVLTDENDLEKAVSLLKQAVALSPENPKAHELLANAYLKKGDLPEAQISMEKAIALSPETSALHFKLGQIYRKQKRMDLAQREFQIVEKLNSTHSSSETPNPFLPTPAPPK